MRVISTNVAVARDGKTHMTRTNVSRRQVLRSGAITAGALVLGSPAVAQADGEGIGGNGFLTNAGLDRLGMAGNVFEVTGLDEGIWLRDVQAACDRGATADYQAWRIVPEEGESAGLFVNQNRNMNVGATAQFTEIRANCGEGYLEHPTSTDGTRTITRVSFGSAEE